MHPIRSPPSTRSQLSGTILLHEIAIRPVPNLNDHICHRIGIGLNRRIEKKANNLLGTIAINIANSDRTGPTGLDATHSHPPQNEVYSKVVDE